MTGRSRPAPVTVLDDAHATYPHVHGFHAGGARALVVRRGPASEVWSVDWHAPDRAPRAVWRVPGAHAGPVWPEASVAGEQAAVVAAGALWWIDLTGVTPPRVLHRAAEGRRLQNLVSVDPRGGRVVAVEEPDPAVGHAPGDSGAACVVVEVPVGAGAGGARELVRLGWHANHPQLSPMDPDWLGLAHEGPAREVSDRVWAWHARLAPAGVCVTDQHLLADTPGAFVALGHERWLHHARGLVAVAYGESEAGPRGLWTTTIDDAGGRRTWLAAPGERFWHVDVSRDGRFAVVDTKGRWDAPGRAADEGAPFASDVVLVDLVTGTQRLLARTWARRHPQHPHPVLTPDGGAVLFTDSSPDLRAMRVARIGL
jgi:hypothetical protein